MPPGSAIAAYEGNTNRRRGGGGGGVHEKDGAKGKTRGDVGRRGEGEALEEDGDGPDARVPWEERKASCESGGACGAGEEEDEESEADERRVREEGRERGKRLDEVPRQAFRRRMEDEEEAPPSYSEGEEEATRHASADHERG